MKIHFEVCSSIIKNVGIFYYIPAGIQRLSSGIYHEYTYNNWHKYFVDTDIYIYGRNLGMDKYLNEAILINRDRILSDILL